MINMTCKIMIIKINKLVYMLVCESPYTIGTYTIFSTKKCYISGQLLCDPFGFHPNYYIHW